MEQELAYSFHLGSDKNKSKVAKKTAKGNVSGTTSLSNNAIQNANDVTKDDYKALQDEFNVTKENIKNQIRELEKRNIVIPSEFKTMVESTNVDSFTDLNECQEFYQKLKSLLDEKINVT